jgi:hypothetical protein
MGMNLLSAVCRAIHKNIEGIQQNIRTGAIDVQHQIVYFQKLGEPILEVR